MDQLNEKLSSLLNDPEGMERIRQMAQNLLADNQKKSQPEQSENHNDIDIGAAMKMINLIKSGNRDDDRVKLLLALKPNLSSEKQLKVDSAIKILKLIELAPLLRDAGLFNL